MGGLCNRWVVGRREVRRTHPSTPLEPLKTAFGEAETTKPAVLSNYRPWLPSCEILPARQRLVQSLYDPSGRSDDTILPRPRQGYPPL